MLPVIRKFLKRFDGRTKALEEALEGRRRTEEALRSCEAQLREVTTIAGRPRSEEMLHSVVDKAIDGIITIDTRGRIESFNPAAEEIFGYRAEEVIGRNINMLMPEPYHSRHDGYLGNYLGTGERRIIGVGREVVGRRKDGSTFPMDLAVSEFMLGERRLFTGIVRDITERKRMEQELRQGLEERAQAEERMRSVVNHVVDAIITIDEHGIVATFNPAAEKIFGYTTDDVIGRNVSLLMPEPDRSRHDSYIANYLRTGQAKIIGVGREVVGRCKNGLAFPMELAINEFRLGKRRYFTGIVRDITERKRLEQELRRRLDELRTEDRQKNEFLAMLGHELRNPLAPMRNALQIIRMPNADLDMVNKARDIMERQLQHLVRLVDDLLDVSRIISGKIELRKQPVDIYWIVERAVETANPIIETREHALHTDLPEKPVWVEGDPVRLAQVIANLLTNAAKYTERAGQIWLSVKREGGLLVLRVRDSGIGIDPEVLPRIFDVFVQADPSLARSQGGLGIGLTLVKRIVEMHGGTIEAHSPANGEGSEFIVRLPVIEKKEDVLAAETDGPQPRVPDALHRRVLVVDDNVDAAESITAILRWSGYDARCVYDGPSALEAALDYKPHVVVLDIGLPGLDGYEVARRLRAQPQFAHTPIVALTGYGQQSDRERSREAGFDAHLIKPVDPAVLKAFIASGGAANADVNIKRGGPTNF